MPLVSVVMPVYNSAATLGAAVRSVLTQTHSDLEPLVTDDRSSDGSMDLLREFAEQDERVRPESAPEQGGAGRARNLAIERARGDYIAFLDSDDMWLPEKTEKQLAFAAEDTAPLTFTSYFKMDADHDGESTDWVPNGRVIRAREHVDYRAMLVQDHIGALTAMYDRTVLGTRLMPEMRKRQDYALWLSIMRDGADARGLASRSRCTGPTRRARCPPTSCRSCSTTGPCTASTSICRSRARRGRCPARCGSRCATRVSGRNVCPSRSGVRCGSRRAAEVRGDGAGCRASRRGEGGRHDGLGSLGHQPLVQDSGPVSFVGSCRSRSNRCCFAQSR